MLIKNFDSLATTPQRKTVLEVIEAGLAAIEPDHFVNREVRIDGSNLKILDKSYDLNRYKKIYLLGFGKGSAGISKMIEEVLGNKLTEGYVIDTRPETFSKIKFTQGTHPLP